MMIMTNKKKKKRVIADKRAIYKVYNYVKNSKDKYTEYKMKIIDKSSVSLHFWHPASNKNPRIIFCFRFLFYSIFLQCFCLRAVQCDKTKQECSFYNPISFYII